MANQNQDPKVLMTRLQKVVEGVLKSTGNLNVSQEIQIHERDVIEYESRMRVSGMEKFNAPCYVASISYYRDEASQAKQDACGVMVVYIEEESVSKLLTAMGYKTAKASEEEAILDHCGELCNLISGNFKNELAGFGYSGLVSTAPITAKNSIPSGVDFPYSQYKLYEADFYLWKEKILVLGLCMA